MNKPNFNLVIVGVGGQGTLMASRLLGRLAMDAGSVVKVSEVHGMSQRGGSVITHVRMGETVYSPLVSLGDADFLLSFEALEAARAAVYLKPEGIAHWQFPGLCKPLQGLCGLRRPAATARDDHGTLCFQ